MCRIRQWMQSGSQGCLMACDEALGLRVGSLLAILPEIGMGGVLISVFSRVAYGLSVRVLIYTPFQ